MPGSNHSCFLAGREIFSLPHDRRFPYHRADQAAATARSRILCPRHQSTPWRTLTIRCRVRYAEIPMKWLSLLFLACFVIPVAGADLPSHFHHLDTGSAAPDFQLPGINGRDYTLADFAAAEVLMVYFTSNHCPVCHAQDPRLLQLIEEVRGRSFAVVAINPNSPEGLRPDELGYSKYDDSFADMKLYARDSKLLFPTSTMERRRKRPRPTVASPRLTSSFLIRRGRCVIKAGWTIPVIWIPPR